MNAVAKAETGAVVVAKDRAEMIAVLKASLYPGAKNESVEMVLAYCDAARLDPMQKPVHIVPMNVKTGEDADGNARYEKRDVVMPGIGLYRIQASRGDCYAGMDEPEFGPTKVLTYRKKVTEYPNGQKKTSWQDVELEYPEWCKVTIYKIVQGHRSPFTSVEYWIENYATAGRWSNAPNEMWERRPRGQLVKCAEAQALRKAFPEVGAAPTAEEMEGRDLIEHEPAESTLRMPQAKADVIEGEFQPVEQPAERTAAEAPAAEKPATPKRAAPPPAPAEESSAAVEVINAAMLKMLRINMTNGGVSDEKFIAHFGVLPEQLPKKRINEALPWAKAGGK